MVDIKVWNTSLDTHRVLKPPVAFTILQRAIDVEHRLTVMPSQEPQIEIYHVPT